jgi:protoporphyrinogen/coproporphyrinogen III oxidase
MAQVVVVGGGISGLAAAYRLSTIKKERNLDLNITLVEAAPRLGGLIRSQSEDDFVVEHGPDAFLIEEPWLPDLCQKLQLGQHLIRPKKGKGRAFVARRGRLVPLPAGFSMIAPSEFWPFFKSPLFSPLGKLRAAADLFLPRGNERKEEESVAQFVERRLGKEIFERVGQAVIGGIYTADAGSLSASAAIPRFVELERRYGSLIRGLRQEAHGLTAGGARYSLFQTLDTGLSGLVEAIAGSLGQERIMLESEVLSLLRPAAQTWLVGKANKESLEANGVILALPSHQAAKLLRSLNADLSKALDSIESASSMVLNFLFRREQFACPDNCFGFVVPVSEGGNILAASFISEKFANRAPEGMAVVRVFVGGALMGQLLQRDDRELEGLALSDLQKYLNIKGGPVKSWIQRWPKSMPQYQLGHAQRVAQIEQQVRELDGLALAGNCYHGVGIPDCVESGEVAAKIVVDSLDRRGLL